MALRRFLRFKKAFPAQDDPCAWPGARPHLLCPSITERWTHGGFPRRDLYQPRPWIGTVNLAVYPGEGPNHKFMRRLMIVDDTSSHLILKMITDNSIIQIATVRPNADIPIFRMRWELDDLDLSAIAPPIDLGMETDRNDSAQTGGGPSALEPTNFKGRWSTAKFSGFHHINYVTDDDPPLRPYLQITWYCWFTNGCTCQLVRDWTDTTPGLTYTDITPEEESDMILLLQSEGFNFDPERLFISAEWEPPAALKSSPDIVLPFEPAPELIPSVLDSGSKL
jgi:hypothetical protein